MQLTMMILRTKPLVLAALVGAALATMAGAGPAAAANLTVCSSGCSFTQIAPAVAAANDGDTISIGPGTYTGGFTIDVSVKLVGAGPDHTIISGGGPVITIGQIFAASEPTVSIDGVTITGGVTRSSPESVPCTGKEGVWAAGGGIEVPPSTESGGPCSADDFGGGAAVTITNSIITGNLVAPSDVNFFGGAWAFGGGIDTSGSLTLANTIVRDNRIGSASGLSGFAGVAEGGGIFSARGDVTITNTTISGNQAAASPHGRIADAAGIASGGTFTMSNSLVTDNSATVNSDFFRGFIQSAGIHIKEGAQAATISNTTISDNAATVTTSLHGAFINSGGLSIDICGPAPCVLSNDKISDNSVSATTLPGSFGNASGRSGAGEFGGTLSNVQVTGNSVDVSSAAGNATALGGASVFDFGTISNSIISDNHVQAAAPLGSVDVRGGAINVFGPTTLRNSTVSRNTVDVSTASGSAFGGGVYDDGLNPDGPPGGPLVLENSDVTANTLSGTAGIQLQGGGIYLRDNPIKLRNSAITENAPDQCFGC
jgi:hypothetical protein